MEIPQPTLNKILNAPIEEVVNALVEGKIMDINGGDHMVIKKRYNSKTCGFEWHSSEKDYEMSVDCKSGEISMKSVAEKIQKPPVEQGFCLRETGNDGIEIGHQKVCKCTNCGYVTEKPPVFHCRNIKCLNVVLTCTGRIKKNYKIIRS